MTDELLTIINNRIKVKSKGSLFTAKELLADIWGNIDDPKQFGLEFRNAVESGSIQRAEFVKIRTSGRENEYKKV